MNRFLPVFFAFILFPLNLFSSPYNMILVGDPVLEDIRFLSLESGKAFLSFTLPLAPYEVEQFLDSLDTSLFSEQAREAYNRIRERLESRATLTLLSSDNFSMTLNINATLEARARLNTDISWYSVYPKVTPFITLPINFFFADSVQLYIEPSLTMDIEEYFLNDQSLAFNSSLDFSKFDWSQPFRAFAAAGGSWWNFQIGRDRLSHGTGQMGNLAISDNPDYYDFMRLSLFSQNIKYSFLVNQMPLNIKPPLYEIPPENRDDYLLRSMNRYFYLHRLDFKLFDVLSIGIMEGVMVGNSPLEIRFLNPLMIFHSLYSWNHYDEWFDDKDHRSVIGSIFSLEINWNIIRSLAFYGQFVLNEFATPGEISQRTDQPPNALGFLAGIQYSHSFNTWASTSFFEFTYTYPYLYLNPSPFASFISMRNLSDSHRVHYSFIGYPRDLLVFTLGTNFFRSDNTLDISGFFSLLLNGERGITYDWERTAEAANRLSPSGTAENKYILTLSAGWKINNYLRINGSVTGIHSRNNNHISGQNETGLQTTVSVNFSY